MQLLIDKLQREFAMTDPSFRNNIERRSQDPSTGLRFQIARSVAKNNKSSFGHVHHLGPVVPYSLYLTYLASLSPSLRNGTEFVLPKRSTHDTPKSSIIVALHVRKENKQGDGLHK